jgi:hypothetical protein
VATDGSALRRWGVAAILAAALCRPGGAPAAPPGGQELSFASLNRLYPDLSAEAAPVAWGPVTVRLSSPKASLRLTAHRLRLEPLADGTHRVWGEATFSGAGEAVADLEAAGLAHRQTDRLVLPRQTRQGTGRVRIVRGEDAYWVTALESPASVELDVHSGLARDLGAWCEETVLLSLLGAECGALERILSHAAVPLPPPGTTYRIAFAELEPPERAELDLYLAGAARR